MAFIKIDREILSSYCFANPNHLKVWIWLLVKANFKKTFVSLKIGKGYITVQVGRGQLIFGRFKAEEELGLDGSMIYRILQKFEEQGQIKIEPNNQYSIITICKYNLYQNNLSDSEQPMNSQRATNELDMNSGRTAGELDMNTHKEGLEGKESKEYIEGVIYAFDSIEFIRAYNNWYKYRKQKKKTLTERGMELQSEMLKKYPESIAIEIINKSIMNGWIGLFEPKGTTQSLNLPANKVQESGMYEVPTDFDYQNLNK